MEMEEWDMDDYKIIDVDVHNEQDDSAASLSAGALALAGGRLWYRLCRLGLLLADRRDEKTRSLRGGKAGSDPDYMIKQLIEGYNLIYAVLTGSSTTFHQRMIRITRQPYARPITIT